MLRAEKLVLYDTNRYMLLVGHNTAETLYRVIKLDRNVVKPSSLAEILIEDPVIYTKGTNVLLLLALVLTLLIFAPILTLSLPFSGPN
jgi:hypothetical protein